MLLVCVDSLAISLHLLTLPSSWKVQTYAELERIAVSPLAPLSPVVVDISSTLFSG